MTKLKLIINIGTKLNHFDTWHNCEVKCKKKNSKKIKKYFKKFKKKTHKLTHSVDFNIVWSKLTERTKLNHFKKTMTKLRQKKFED